MMMDGADVDDDNDTHNTRTTATTTEQDAILNMNHQSSSSAICTNRWMCLIASIGLCNTCCIAALCVVIFFLGTQVQSMTGQLNEEEEEISMLKHQVENQQATQIQELTQQVEDQHSYTIYQMAGTFTLLTCLLTMFHMVSHLRSFHEPLVQRKIVTILWMSPIYSVTSFLSLLFPVTEGYLAIIKDFYEAYVVYTFLSFLIAVLGRGNREIVVEKLARHANHLKEPTRCFRSLYDPPPDTSDEAKANAVLLECQILAMQFVLVRPLTSIASFLVLTFWHPHAAAEGSDDGSSSSSSIQYFTSPNFYIAMVQNISVFLAFTGLIKFYHAVRDDLKWLKPFSKFLAIKGIVFLTFWQGLVIAIFVNISHHQKENGNDKDTSLTSYISLSESSSSSSSNNIDQDIYSNSNTTTKLETSTTMEEVLPEGMGFTDYSNSTDTTIDAEENLHEEQWDPRAQAVFIQNTLICLEMLFFSLAHWCVFPTEEWEPGYQPKHMARPGLGIKDFAKDVRSIIGRGPKARLGAPLPLPQNPRDFETDDVGPPVDEDVILYMDDESPEQIADQEERNGADMELI